jgi:hypothetical protein
MFDVSSRAKLSVSALAERKIASARPRKYGLLLRAEEEMLLYGQALARAFARSHSACNQPLQAGDQTAARYSGFPRPREIYGQDSLTEPKDNGCRDADSAEECVGAAVVAH